MAAALLGDKQARIWRWTLAVMEEQRNQFGFQQNAECTRTCRAFRASRRFAASRPLRCGPTGHKGYQTRRLIAALAAGSHFRSGATFGLMHRSKTGLLDHVVGACKAARKRLAQHDEVLPDSTRSSKGHTSVY